MLAACGVCKFSVRGSRIHCSELLSKRQGRVNCHGWVGWIGLHAEARLRSISGLGLNRVRLVSIFSSSLIPFFRVVTFNFPVMENLPL